jgi:hypothetical protein
MKSLSLFVFIGFLNLAFGQLNIKELAPMQNEAFLNANGDSLSLQSAKGKLGLVVVFSCNTCPFVVGSEDFAGWEVQYDSLYVAAKEKNIGFILVNSNEGKRFNVDSFDEMVRHAKEKHYNMPYLLDKNAALAVAFGAKTTPHVFFFDENLQLIYSGSIDNLWDKNRKTTDTYLHNALIAKAKGKKINPNTTPPKGCGIKKN